ncbi:ArsR/SmtB family transcription factor [Demequina zhanjiangensis]|uniref:Metalloregulator ArsR/SmtB family transcription factor n=1 Tax=Demequina zhanjiangensis TaxID=3051659 RepID=A0ABT8G2S6_9MICO|nr:metalloregulator ArsR/SmtB family transcription factor [Demequina sp. SYSU T00b26]MDN4473443.1 metalloregulator ArsR/SmtB family transcription factor [Demequina sp. SYSU T00b26]
MTQLSSLEILPRPAEQAAPCAAPAEEVVRDPAPSVDLLQAIADPVRWTVLDRLSAGTRCVCDLQEHVDVSNTLLSYHLRILRDAGLVTTARRGRWIDYSLAADASARLAAALPGAFSPAAPAEVQP